VALPSPNTLLRRARTVPANAPVAGGIASVRARRARSRARSASMPRPARGGAPAARSPPPPRPGIMAPDGPSVADGPKNPKTPTLSASLSPPRYVAHKGLTDTTVTGGDSEKAPQVRALTRFPTLRSRAVSYPPLDADSRSRYPELADDIAVLEATVTPEFTAADKAALADQNRYRRQRVVCCWVRRWSPVWAACRAVYPGQRWRRSRWRARRDPGVTRGSPTRASPGQLSPRAGPGGTAAVAVLRLPVADRPFAVDNPSACSTRRSSPPSTGRRSDEPPAPSGQAAVTWRSGSTISGPTTWAGAEYQRANRQALGVRNALFLLSALAAIGSQAVGGTARGGLGSSPRCSPPSRRPSPPYESLIGFPSLSRSTSVRPPVWTRPG